MSHVMHRRVGMILVAASVLLAGCGYHLRGSTASTSLPASVASAKVDAPRGLANALISALQARGLAAGVDTTDADLTIRSRTPRFDRRLLSVDDRTGKTREYELLLDARYSVDQAGKTRLIEDGRVLVRRDFLVDTSAIIGKSTEEAVLRDEMRIEAAERIIDRIAASLASG